MLASYDIESKTERQGALQNVVAPVDMQALEDGTILVNLTGSHEILAIDGTTMLEVARLPSSALGAKRPVHSYISPERNSRHYWMTLNDGAQAEPTTNSAAFVDVTAGSATRLQRVGEVRLGVGHHKVAFSNTSERVVISNISDCADVLSAFDYSNIADIRKLETFTSTEAGWTAADPGMGGFNPRFCDVTYQRGLPPAPHGCATSKTSGKAYCNLTGSGEIVVVNLDSNPVTFTPVATGGAGGGYTGAHPAGRYLYSMQEQPREGKGGVACQIGQIAVIDASTDTIVAQTPVRYRGPDCNETLMGTAAESANLGHSYFSADGSRLFIPTSGGFGQTDARVDQLVVLDTSNPAAPVQLASVQVGQHTNHSAAALSGDGKWLFVVNGIDSTVSQVDLANASVVHTFTVYANPKVVATFGSKEGPSEQTGPLH